MGPHCLPVCKNRFEKFARIFSRPHKQMAFSDAGFLGVLKVKFSALCYRKVKFTALCFIWENNDPGLTSTPFTQVSVVTHGSLVFHY